MKQLHNAPEKRALSVTMLRVVGYNRDSPEHARKDAVAESWMIRLRADLGSGRKLSARAERKRGAACVIQLIFAASPTEFAPPLPCTHFVRAACNSASEMSLFSAILSLTQVLLI